jgi:site-specific DNA-methyltransferase (adenine-specific)
MGLPDHLKILMSSKKKDWATPPELFGPVNELFDFDLDVCATAGNTKCAKFISPEDNAFEKLWVHEPTKGLFKPARCWMNPPYGKPEHPCKEPHERCKKKVCKERGFHVSEYIPGIEDWVARAYMQSDESRATVVCLLPARTDTEWFQIVWSHASLICFLRGRFKFVGADAGATFPNVIAVFSPDELDDEKYEGMTVLGNVLDPRDGQILTYQEATNG